MAIIGALVKRSSGACTSPLGLLMSWYRSWSLLKLKKEDATCTHCRICADVCPMEITEVFSSQGRVDVTFGDCILCLKCIEHCPGRPGTYGPILWACHLQILLTGIFQPPGPGDAA